MTFPRRLAAVNGGELSHSVAPPREGSSPSMGNLTVAGVVCCATLLSSAKVAIGIPIAVASIVANMSLCAFMMNAALQINAESIAVDIDDSLRKGLRRFLRQIVPAP